MISPLYRDTEHLSFSITLKVANIALHWTFFGVFDFPPFSLFSPIIPAASTTVQHSTMFRSFKSSTSTTIYNNLKRYSKQFSTQNKYAKTRAGTGSVEPIDGASSSSNSMMPRGPVSWASLGLVAVAAASAVSYYQIERERRLEEAMGKIVSVCVFVCVYVIFHPMFNFSLLTCLCFCGLLPSCITVLYCTVRCRYQVSPAGRQILNFLQSVNLNRQSMVGFL